MSKETVKAQKNELVKKITEGGHLFEDDYSENKNIQDDDFDKVVIPFLSNPKVAESIQKIQGCYHVFD